MAYPTDVGTVTNEVDPVSRIEGHLGVAVVAPAGTITDAFAHGNLWRGFENFLLGREINDAITFVQRICGVCPVPHGMTSTHAVDAVLGYSQNHITFAGPDTNGYGVPPKAISIRNLVHASDSIMSAITHFYHLAAPSYIQGPAIPPWTPYFNDGYYTEISHPTASMRSHGRVTPVLGADGFSDGLWSTVIRSYVVALRVRRVVFEAGALFAGRMPMTSTYCGGGVTFDGQEDLTTRATTFATIMKEAGLFVIQEYVPIALALGVLYPDYDNLHNGGSGYGSGLGRYLAWGAFPDSTDLTSSAPVTYAGGYKDLNGGGGDFTAVNKGQIYSQFIDPASANQVPKCLTEDIASSRYVVDTTNDAAAYTVGAHLHTSATAAYPGDVSRTKPKRANGYTYMKAPRWNGKSCEVGPMARMFVSGLFADNATLASTLTTYYTAYVKTASGNTGLNPAMVAPDIAVALLKAGLATVRNATVAGWLALPVTTDFTYAMIGANLGALATHLGTTGAHATIAAAYMNADTVITGSITTWVLSIKAGASTMDRLRARALECLFLVQQVLGVFTPATGTWTATTPGTWGYDTEGGTPVSWVGRLKAQTGGANDTEFSTWASKTIPTGTKQGWGVTEAARGALMHQATIVDGKITKYQCIVPTTWNGSPVIGNSSVKLNHGAIEASCIGVPFANLAGSFTSSSGSGTVTSAGGVEVLRIAQSFDPCIACAIH